MKKLYKVMLSIVITLLSLYLIFTIFKLNVLPNKYLIIISLFILILNLIEIILIIKFKKIGLISFILLSIIICAGIYYSQNTLNFLNDSFNNHSVETTTYKVLVHNKSYNMDKLKNKSLGYFENDIQYKECLKKIKIKTNNNGYNNLIELYENLIDDNLDSIVLDDGYISILEEIYPNLNEETKVIYSFKINKNVKKNYTTISKLKPINIYISGSDSRSEVMAEKSRTDVNMILTINPNNNSILVTSIPRDYYVNLYNTSGLKDKLTHSGIYGIDTSVKTIENLLDINIDYYIKINFQSVISLVDLVGGVDIYSDLSFRTNCGDGGAKVTYVKEGMNHFNGAEALSYARERYAYENGDGHRMQNTQQVFKAVFDKIMSDKTLLFKYEELLDSFSGLYLTNIPSDYIKLLVKKQIVDMKAWDFTLTKLSGTGTKAETYSIPGFQAYVMIPNEEDIKKAHDNIHNALNEKVVTE